MAGNYWLVPASLLIEDDSDSLQALFKQHKVAAKKGGVKPQSKPATDTSRKSGALSQLAKVLKGTADTRSGKNITPPKGVSKPDIAIVKAGAAVSKPEKSKRDGGGVPGKRQVGSSAGTAAVRGAGGKKSPGPLALKKSPGLAGIKEPHMDVEHPPGKWDAFEHDTPSLKDRAKPGFIPHDERHADFHDRYHAKGATLGKMKYLGSTSSHVFDGTMDDGTRFIAKPHEHPWGEVEGAEGAQPEHWERRHNAVARLLNHMGAGHMVAPATTANIHGSEAMPSDHPMINDFDGDKRSAHYHAGKKAFVTEFAPDHVNGREGHEIADKVDGDHRLMGMITHLLTHNSDGHRGNVMIHGETGHPTLIDHDLSMTLGARRGEIRSQFLPGEAYDYQAKMGKIGTNYPPRVKKTLEWLAGGGHHHKEGGLDLHNNDKVILGGMAKMMLKHGLEGTMSEMTKAGTKFRG